MKKLLQSLFILLLVASTALAQDRTVTGTVVAKEDGSPLPGVSIQVKGTKIGAQTGADGKFTINIPSGSTTLSFSFIGYSTQNVVIGSGSSINVAMTLDSKQLSEVVVTALGFQADKDKLGTSQSSVKGDALAKSGETSILNGLAAKASGVQVVRTSGDPGAGTYVQIRGQSTITGDLQPLFIIDGIPVSNSNVGSGTAGVVQQSRLSDLNAQDIESMEVLKGAAAAALWGSRAANGVVVITTKKGKAGNGNKINISLNTTYSMDVLGRSIPLQRSYGQGWNGLFVSGGAGASANSNSQYSWGDKISDRTGGSDTPFGTAYFLLPDGTKRYAIASGTSSNPHGGKNSKEVFDHSEQLFGTGWFLDNTLTLSGGDDKSLYYISISNLDNEGMIKGNSDYHRKTFKINADRRFSENLKLSASMGYSYVNSGRIQQGSNTSGIMLGGLRTSPDFDNRVYEGSYVDATGAIFPNRQVSYRNPLGARVNSGYDNPFWVANRIVNTTSVNRLVNSFEAKYDVKPWLSFIARGGADYYNDKRTDYWPVIATDQQGGRFVVANVSELQVNGDFISKFSTKINDNIDLSGLLGFNYNNQKYESLQTAVTAFILPDAPPTLSNSSASNRTPTNYLSLVRSTAGYSQLSLSAYDQLYLDVTARAERASTFSKVFYYPSASLAWQFNKLKSLENSQLLSFGKLRASYGEVGVQPGAYLADSYYVAASISESWGSGLSAASATYGGGYLRSGTQGNPNLEPERKKEFEVGADLRLFSDRLSLSGTYYNNKTTGAIFSVDVPASTGYSSTNDNAAEISNKGLEFDLGYNWLKSGDLSISSNVTWSRNRNKVLDLKGVASYFLAGYTGSSSRAVEGHPLGVLWGVDFQRDASGKLILDADGFPQANATESVIGDPNPEWISGINNNIRYKKFGFSFLIDHVQGGDIWNGTRGALTTFGTAGATGVESTAPSAIKTYYGTVIPAGTKFRGSVVDFGGGPVALNQDWYTDLGGGFGPVGAQFIEDGTRTRLREVSLSYSLSGEKFRNATKLQSVDFSITGRNLYMWTNYTGFDPETNNTGPSNGRGLDYFNNPNTKSFFFTIKVNY